MRQWANEQSVAGDFPTSIPLSKTVHIMTVKTQTPTYSNSY